MRGLRTAAGAVMVCASLEACNALTGIGDLSVNSSSLDSPDAYLLPGSDGGGSVAVFDGAVTKDATVDAAVPDASPVDSSTPVADASRVDAAVPDASPVDPGPCVPASVGPKYGKDFGGGQGGWTNRSGILQPGDDVVARANGSVAPISAKNFGFALPANAPIVGITVEIGRNASAPLDPTAAPLSDGAIDLPKGDPKTNGAWPDGTVVGPFPNATYGSSTDAWNATWIGADINAPSFSVSITPTGDGFGHVDSVGVTVTYCVTGAPPQ